MTQQPYAQPQYPGYPQQVPPQQYAPPAAPQYPAQPYPVQQAPQYAAPVQPQTPPLATGSLDDYYSQPSAASGPSISWTDKNRQPKPLGTSYAGIVARDVTNADVQQQTDFNTKAPLFYRDGRPKFAMKVPLRVQPCEEFPEGEATWYVKGQARDELVRAMAEAGCDGAPKAGALIVVTLVQRRASGQGLNPANVVQVQYQPADGAGAASPAPAPTQQAPVQQEAPPAWAAPQPQQAPQLAQPVQPPAQPVVQQQAPQQGAPQPPSDLSPEQAALLARLTGGQPTA